MDDIKKALEDKKAEFESLEAPIEMEGLLRQALQGKKKKISYRPVAAILIAVLIFTYNFDVLAYYGKKFAGYDQITIGALSKLNEEGKGQEVGKSCLFSNGAEVTIDGIMFDDNELLIFYKLKTSTGTIEEIIQTGLPRFSIHGLKPMEYHSTNGEGRIVDDHTMTFIDTMEPLMFYEKWLRFDIRMMVNGELEIQSVNFTLDRNRAMERTAKLELNAEVVLDDCRIVFEEFTASVMSSMIKGRIIPQSDESRERYDPRTSEGGMEIPHLNYDIVSDEGEVMRFSGGQSSSGGNITFTGKGDALPENFKTLQVKNIRMDTMKIVDKTVALNTNVKDMPVSEDLTINDVYVDGGDLCMSVSSRGIPVVGLFRGEEQLEQVNSKEFELEIESDEPMKRVFRFRMSAGDADKEDDKKLSGPMGGPDAAEGLELDIKYIRYTRMSADTIDIPID